MVFASLFSCGSEEFVLQEKKSFEKGERYSEMALGREKDEE